MKPRSHRALAIAACALGSLAHAVVPERRAPLGRLGTSAFVRLREDHRVEHAEPPLGRLIVGRSRRPPPERRAISRARVAATYATRTASSLSCRSTSSRLLEKLDRARIPRAASPRVCARVDVARRLLGRQRRRRDRPRTTTGNSSPLALWTVMMRTPSVPSSTTGASARLRAPLLLRGASRTSGTTSRPPLRTCARDRARARMLPSAARRWARWPRPACARVASRSAPACRRSGGGCARVQAPEDGERLGDLGGERVESFSSKTRKRARSRAREASPVG